MVASVAGSLSLDGNDRGSGMEHTMYEDRLAAIVRLREAFDLDADAVEGLLALVSEDVLDAVETEDREYLLGARRELHRAYTVLAASGHDISETEPPFLLGRVAGLLELVGASALRQRPVEFERELNNERNLELLYLLREGEKTSTELTGRLSVDKSMVSRRLRKLEAAGLVIRQLSGRQLYSRLSLAARSALLDQRPNYDWLDRSAVQPPRLELQTESTA